MQLKLSLLGSPRIEFNGKDVNGRLPIKARTLLYYLANNPQPHNRDQLAEWIWEGRTNPRGSLRVALTTIRGHLGKDFFAGGRDGLTINKNDNYMLDVEEFDNFIRLADKVTGATERAHLRDAVALFHGDFLQDFAIGSTYLYDEWLLPERERLRQQALAAYDRLVEICREQGDFEAGIRYALALLQLEPWRESAHRQLMRFYDLTGKRELAIKQFDTCADVVEREFGLSPTDETFALYWQIVDPQAVGVTEPLTAPEEAGSPSPFLVPKLVPYFSGRDAELVDLQEKLLPGEDRRLVGLVGPPGVGKSALAVELAHRLRNAFPDGVLWMHADLDDSMSVAERWANAYGYDFSRISDLKERTAVLRDLLSEKQALIICDDVTSAAKTRPFLPEGCCTILLTSRSEDIIHKLGAELVDVNVLSEGDGRALLTSIIGEERVAAEKTAAAEILRLLDGLPLAIAIAGQRLALRSRRKLASFAAQLHDESARIDLADRDRAIRTSFAVSWNGLDPTRQQVFALLAVFTGRSFAIHAAAAIAEMDYYDMLERLDDLASLSLLNDEGDERYRQHTLLADFAHEKLGDNDDPHRRMITYFQTFAADHSEDYAELELEWENLLASIEQAQQMVQWSAVLDMTNTLQPAWFRRGRYHEARRAFPQAVAAAKVLDDQPALAQCLYHWGYICWEQNDWDEAEGKLVASLNLYEELGDRAGQASVQLQLGILAKDQANFAKAERFLAASRRIRELLDDQKGIAETIYEQANLQYSCGNYEVARQFYEQALIMQESLGDQLGVLRTLRSLGNVVGILDPKDLTLKKQYVQRAFDLAEELQDQVEIAVIYNQMFTVSRREGQYKKAEELAFKSLEYHRKLGHRRGQAMVYYLLADFYQQQGLYDKALKYGQDSVSICRTLKDIPGTAFSLQRLGDIYNGMNRPEQSCQYWHEALELARKLDHKGLLQDLSAQIHDC